MDLPAGALQPPIFRKGRAPRPGVHIRELDLHLRVLKRLGVM
ncbi:MAG TPA: hypothetical protein PKA17_02515 [Phenylobacterium sp.]|nr:hypothetical protein [Phenylobacterium sp.]